MSKSCLADGGDSFGCHHRAVSAQLIRKTHASAISDRHQLLEVRPNLYLETKESGVAKPGVPGRDGFGSLRHRVLEADVQVSLFPEYNTLDRRPRAGERQFPLPSTVN